MAKVTATDSITGIPAVITVYSISIPQVDCPALDTGAMFTVIATDSIAAIPAVITVYIYPSGRLSSPGYRGYGYGHS